MASLVSIENNLNESLVKMDAQMKAFPWNSRDSYMQWLSQTYFYVCHSTRLLCLAGASFSQDDNKFHLRGIEHMKEEKSHEKLALKDLQDLGGDIRNYEAFPATEALYQTCAYAITNKDPISIYGYILCLEGIAVTSAGHCANEIKKAYPGRNVSRFLDVHGNEDPDHLVKALAILKTVSDHRLTHVQRMMSLSFSFYSAMLSTSRTLQTFEFYKPESSSMADGSLRV